MGKYSPFFWISQKGLLRCFYCTIPPKKNKCSMPHFLTIMLTFRKRKKIMRIKKLALKIKCRNTEKYINGYSCDIRHLLQKYHEVERLELILLKTLPIIGPRISKAAMTTMATKTRIKAYSTRPCPFSLDENNMSFFPPFQRIPEIILRGYFNFTSIISNGG